MRCPPPSLLRRPPLGARPPPSGTGPATSGTGAGGWCRRLGLRSHDPLQSFDQGNIRQKHFKLAPSPASGSSRAPALKRLPGEGPLPAGRLPCSTPRRRRNKLRGGFPRVRRAPRVSLVSTSPAGRQVPPRRTTTRLLARVRPRHRAGPRLRVPVRGRTTPPAGCACTRPSSASTRSAGRSAAMSRSGPSDDTPVHYHDAPQRSSTPPGTVPLHLVADAACDWWIGPRLRRTSRHRDRQGGHVRAFTMPTPGVPGPSVERTGWHMTCSVLLCDLGVTAVELFALPQ